jgi:hypothetical protein
MDARVIDTLPTVRATLNYIVRGGPRPYSYTFEPPEGTPWRTGEIEKARGVPIHDARPLVGKLSLDEEGFELHPHRTQVTDFYDPAQIRDVYEAEVEALLEAATGAEKVVVFDHTIRSIPRAQAGIKGVGQPVRQVHNDYTALSGPRRVRDHLAPAEAEMRLGRRYLEVNVWRPIKGPLEDQPLAVCDARSIAPDDLIASDLIYRDKVGETYSLAYNPQHRWFYFPRMEADEAILLKCFDSDEASPGRYTAHSAFYDPTAPDKPLPRESIETRALVFLPA